MKKQTSLKVLYTSDIHGNILPINYGTNEKENIGLATYATLVQKKRQEHEQIIVIDNGDLIQGTPIMTHYIKEHAAKPNPMITIMNQIGLDAGVPGNHEFNFGKAILQDAVNQSNYPWLSANILNEKTGKTYFGPSYIVRTLSNGIKVAITGVTTHYIPNWETPEHIQGIKFTDAFSTLKNVVEEIQSNEDYDLLIALYHGGFEKDIETGKATESLTSENQGYEMADKIKGIDILLTGHQHRKLTGRIHDCLVIQPGYNAESYGEITVTFKREKDRWIIKDKQAFVKTLEGVQPDPVIVQEMRELEQSTQTWLDEPIGKIKGNMIIKDPFKARVRKHPFIELIQKIQMEASGADISVTALLGNEATGLPSIITMRDIVTNYKFPNTLVVLSLTGKDIKQALEKSANYFTLDTNGEITVNPDYLLPKPEHYNYDMWEGIKYSIRVSNPEGDKVENISYRGKPLNMEGSYNVVMNNYRASGGGNFDMFKNRPVVKEIQQDMVELISSYIEKRKTIKASVTDNFLVEI